MWVAACHLRRRRRAQSKPAPTFIGQSMAAAAARSLAFSRFVPQRAALWPPVNSCRRYGANHCTYNFQLTQTITGWQVFHPPPPPPPLHPPLSLFLSLLHFSIWEVKSLFRSCFSWNHRFLRAQKRSFDNLKEYFWQDSERIHIKRRLLGLQGHPKKESIKRDKADVCDFWKNCFANGPFFTCSLKTKACRPPRIWPVIVKVATCGLAVTKYLMLTNHFFGFHFATESADWLCRNKIYKKKVDAYLQCRKITTRKRKWETSELRKGGVKMSTAGVSSPLGRFL